MNTENNVIDATDILGGVNAVAAVVPATPGAAAKMNAGEKREYTPRGTTYWCKRVVLKDGVPTGRGRPSFEGIGARTVVYIPKDAEYDAKTYGTGVKFNSHNHRFPFKRIAKDSVPWTFDDGIQPTVPKAKKAKAAPVKAVKAKVVPVKEVKAKVSVAKAKKPAKIKTVAPESVAADAPAPTMAVVAEAVV